MILAGRVSVNGKPIETPALNVGPADVVTLDSAPVGVHDVSAIAFVQMTDSTRISGSEIAVSSHGTPKNA